MLRDLRHAFHTLLRSPGYTLLCTGVLALGIGANAAIFSVLDSVILHALPYPDPGHLVVVWQRFPSMPPPLGPRMLVARRNFREWQRQATLFSGMAAYAMRTFDETSTGHPRPVRAAFASPELLPILGAQPRLGRGFDVANDHTALLADGFFESRFHRDPGAIGQTVTLDGAAYTVVGVLPAGFHLPSTYEGTDQDKPEVFVPLSRLPEPQDPNRSLDLHVFARLKTGATLAQARAEMVAIMARLEQANPELNRGWSASVFDIRTEDSNPKTHLALYVLMGAVGFLLLIACANLANLTLARATLRSRELAVRLAIGATRMRLISQLIAEPLLLSIAGAALGLLLAKWGIDLMVSFKPEDIQRPELIAINLPVLLFAALAGILTTVLFGLAPALSASRADLNTALKSGGGGGTSAARVRVRQFLIALEVALALVLVTGAGLMIRSFQELLAVGVGFRTERIALADVELPAQRYRDDAARSRFFHQLVLHAAAAPGVDSAAIVDNAPLHSIAMSNFYIQGRPDPALDQLPIADKCRITPEYLALIGLRLEAGRWFTEKDLLTTEKGPDAVVLVSRTFARQFFPNENPIGHRLLSPDRKQASEIIGIVSDYRPMGVENGTRPTIFWPDLRLARASLVVRSSADMATLAKVMRDAVWSLDKNLPAAEVQPMAHYVDEWLSQRRFNTFLLGVFAGLAVILGMLGIYGVLASLVASRVREIGIRMAIGATPSQIGRLVLRQSMAPVAAGLAAGIGASLLLGRFLESLLYHVNPREPLTLAVAAVAVLLAAPAAIYVPLRRATSVECTTALRAE